VVYTFSFDPRSRSPEDETTLAALGSRIAYVAALPLAILKIDRVFVAKLPDDSNAKTIVKTIITLHTAAIGRACTPGPQSVSWRREIGGKGAASEAGAVISRC
jgi:predicted signal transduction protein with EAL and GGDEF domain